MSDWKPGDVLIDGRGERLYKIEVSENTRTAWRSGACLVSADGNGSQEMYHPGLRPLVVIDPDDDEQVDRICDLLRDHGGREVKVGIDWLAVQAALREFARPTPPKPVEPTGLGAVVEYQGGRYVRAREQTTVRHWHPADGLGNAFRWDDFNNGAVTVLSEGIPS